MNQPNLIIISSFSLIPYLVVAWGYREMTEGDANAFWIALSVLLGVRLFFSVIEKLGNVLYWRLYGRKLAVGNAVAFLNASEYPPRKYFHDNFGNYLVRIQNGPECPATLRRSAVDIEHMLSMIEQLGISVGARAHSTFEAALDVYAPPSQASHRL
jgi:hypothetical protein